MEVKTLSVLNVIFEMEKLSWRKSLCIVHLWKMVRVWIFDLSCILDKRIIKIYQSSFIFLQPQKERKKIPDAILRFQRWSCLSQQGIT